MRAAMKPPAQSPKSRSQEYLPVSRRKYTTSGHNLRECGLKLLHLVPGADTDANVSGPARPYTTDEDLLLAERHDDVLAGLFHIDHEFVRDRGDELEVMLVEKFEGIVPDIADQLAAFR